MSAPRECAVLHWLCAAKLCRPSGQGTSCWEFECFGTDSVQQSQPRNSHVTEREKNKCQAAESLRAELMFLSEDSVLDKTSA